MIAIIDYGVGNIFSVAKALEHIGAEALVTSRKEDFAWVDGVILPGVGAFGDAMDSLRRLGLVNPIQDYVREGKPLLGICLGMQLLFTLSEEHGQHGGLDFMTGHVIRMQGDYKIPQVGWNQLQLHHQHPVVKDLEEGEFAYFVHSYYVAPADPSVVIASTDYHQAIPAIVAKDNIVGMQFHPEKSSTTGLKLLANFVSWSRTKGAQ